MSFFPLDPFPAEPTSLTTSVPISGLVSSNLTGASIIDKPQTGQITRELLTWRTPHLGYVKMYLNPQQMTTDDGKDITSTRTKGGFVVQYAGENLTQINIDGTTGSSGIEGINILYSIYRAEQEAFEGIALALEERLSVLQANTLTGLSSFLDPNLFLLANDALRNFGRPQPTLASLASNIELFFQGELYRGYFTKFTRTEMAEQPGWFRYVIAFTAYARQGVRRNFMPWHRQPVNPANTHDSGANQLSFPDIINAFEQRETLPAVGSTGNPFQTDPRLSSGSIVSRTARRSTNTAIDEAGRTISGQDLRNL